MKHHVQSMVAVCTEHHDAISASASVDVNIGVRDALVVLDGVLGQRTDQP